MQHIETGGTIVGYPEFTSRRKRRKEELIKKSGIDPRKIGILSRIAWQVSSFLEGAMVFEERPKAQIIYLKSRRQKPVA